MKASVVIQIWEDLHEERPGFYRAYTCDDAETSIGCPVIGYASFGGSHRTIKACVAEVRWLGHDDPIYRNGKRIA